MTATEIVSSEDVALARAERIRRGIADYLETVAEIALAWERRDWQVLGYPDWQAYVDGEFGAERMRLPTALRQKAVVDLRIAGMSQRAIGAAVGVDQATVARDLRAPGDASASPGPAEIRGVDGKTYPAIQPARPAVALPAGVSGPNPADTVWIAAARKAIEAHAVATKTSTRCARSTRTGLTLTAALSAERYQARWCPRCWPPPQPDEQPTPPTTAPNAAGPAGPVTAAGADLPPVDEAHTAIVGAETAAPARSPAPASPGAGEWVTPAVAAAPVVEGSVVDPDPAGGERAAALEEPAGLRLAQIGRLRDVFGWARAGLARHPRYNKTGGGVPRVLGREYVPDIDEAPPIPQSHGRGEVAHVAVSWEPDDYEISILYRSDRYVLRETTLAVADVDQAIDVLCALGVLPARLSTLYAAGARAGLRAGDAIDGRLG